MTQDEFEALYGGGPKYPLLVKPPDFFSKVTGRLGFRPPEEPPRPPKSPRSTAPTQEDSPSGFWVPPGEEAERRQIFSLDDLVIEIGADPEPVEGAARDELEADNEREFALTPDFIAYYLPWHLGGDMYWGIYFRRSKMQDYVDSIRRECGLRVPGEMIIEQVFWHEMEHFEQEKAATALEDLMGQVVYPAWLENRYKIKVSLFDRRAGQRQEIYLIEEALATAREIEWARAREDEGRCPPGYTSWMEAYSRRKSTGYRSFDLCIGEAAKQEARAAFLESVGSRARPPFSRRLDGETAKRLFGTRTSSRTAVPLYVVDH